MSDSVKISVTLPRDVVEQIEALAEANHVTPATAIIDSVRLNGQLTRATGRDGKLLVRNADGTMLEVVRRRG
jgi:hypothetical protein